MSLFLRMCLILGAFASVAVFVQACSRPLPPQASCDFVQNADQQRLSWKGHIPIQLYIHSSVPVEAYPTIERAIEQYNNTIGGGQPVFNIAAKGVSGPMDSDRDGYSTIYWYTDTWDPAKPAEQARTTVYWVGSEIFEADIRINAYSFKYYLGTDNDFKNLDLDSLLVHELGHVLGLAHNELDGSVMHPILDQGEVRRTLGTQDLANLQCEYSKSAAKL